MEITISFNLAVVALWITAYVTIGFVLYIPLVLWTERFISGPYRPFRGTTFSRFVEKLLLCAFAWPIILGYCVKTEIAYHRKGYLGKNKKF